MYLCMAMFEWMCVGVWFVVVVVVSMWVGVCVWVDVCVGLFVYWSAVEGVCGRLVSKHPSGVVCICVCVCVSVCAELSS